MQLKQVDDIDPEALARGVADRTDMLGPAVDADDPLAALAGLSDLEAELCGGHPPVAEPCERLADELLVLERAVHLGCVEEGDPEIDRLAKGFERLDLGLPANGAAAD